MSKLSYVLEFTIPAGQADAFTAKAHGFITPTEANEPGTLRYSWFLNAEGTKCILVEKFASSEALLTHLGNVGPTLPELLAIAPITRFEVLGDPSDDVRAALGDLGAVFFAPLGGFDR